MKHTMVNVIFLFDKSAFFKCKFSHDGYKTKM